MKSYDPYNSNPFETDTSEVSNEFDANRALQGVTEREPKRKVRFITDQLLVDLGIITDTHTRNLK